MDYTSYQDNGITYKSDIIKELSKELGIPEKELQEIVNLNIDYIKKSAVEKDYLLISIPNLCKIRFNMKLGMSSSAYRTLRREGVKKKVELLRKYKIESGGKLLNFKLPLFDRLWRKAKMTYKMHIYRDMYLMIKDVESRSNEIIEEITNKK